VVEACGKPKRLPSPTPANATSGSTRSRNAAVELLRLPWWGTLRMTDRGSPPRARTARSPAASMSPGRSATTSPSAAEKTTERSFSSASAACPGTGPCHAIRPGGRTSPPGTPSSTAWTAAPTRSAARTSERMDGRMRRRDGTTKAPTSSSSKTANSPCT